MRRNWAVKGLKIALFAALFVTIFGFVVMLLWNWLMPALFGWRLIGFWQAIGILVLSKILFGGFHGRHGRHMYWRHRMTERWERALKVVSLNPGRDFEVIALRFDPKDTPDLAEAKKENYLRRYNRPNTANRWHFLTGTEANVRVITDAIGFHYKYDPATDQYAHASAIVVTPAGKVSKYFYGVEYSPRDLRLGLVEASARKSARRWTRFSCSASTTTRRPASTGQSP